MILKPHEFKLHDLAEHGKILRRYAPTSSFSVSEMAEGTYVVDKIRDKEFLPKPFHSIWTGGIILAFLLPSSPIAYPYALPNGVRLPQNALHEGMAEKFKEVFGHTFESQTTESLEADRRWIWVCFHEDGNYNITPNFQNFASGDSFSKYFLAWYQKLWESAS